jgi:hypothetical protein
VTSPDAHQQPARPHRNRTRHDVKAVDNRLSDPPVPRASFGRSGIGVDIDTDPLAKLTTTTDLLRSYKSDKTDPNGPLFTANKRERARRQDEQMTALVEHADAMRQAIALLGPQADPAPDLFDRSTCCRCRPGLRTGHRCNCASWRLPMTSLDHRFTSSTRHPDCAVSSVTG